VITPADLRQWDPLRMEDAFRALGGARDRLLGIDAALPSARPPADHWQGTAAELARAAHDRIALRLRALTDQAAAARPGLAEAIDAVIAVRADLAVLEGLAAADGFAIGDDGRVTDIRDFAGPATVDGSARLADQAAIARRVRQLLARADDVDRRVHDLLVVTQPPLVTPSRAGSVAAWWRALPLPDRERFIAEHPEQAGRLDGLPASVRDAANRRLLAAAVADAETGRLAAADQLKALTDAIDHGRAGMDQIPRRDALTAALARADAHIAMLRSLQERLQAAGARPAFLMAFQPEVGHGRAVVALGNPDTATNVVTLVPGTGARLATITGDLARAEAIADAAAMAAPAQSTAVIAWNGYDAPLSILPDAAEGRFADAAEPLLRSFQDGLRVAHEGPRSRNTVVGHSYGSTVIGHTARDGALDADAIVFAGSPGVGVHDVRGLHRPPDTVYSTTSAADPIEITHSRWLGPADDALGDDPSDPRFGAHVFPADPRGGHSDYWRHDNPALRSFALIATGQEPL
jgi:hypothetical protein